MDVILSGLSTGFDKEIYKPIEGYEGAHRFDSSMKWSVDEEKRLVRTVSILLPSCRFASINRFKLDWRIALPACIMFFALQLDRGNIVQAISETMLRMSQSIKTATRSALSLSSGPGANDQ